MPRRPILLAPLVILALLVPAAAATAARPDRTGIYVGEATHEPFTFAPEAGTFETRFVLRVNGRRVTGIAVNARAECPNVAIHDLRFARLVIRNGPALRANNSFTLQAEGIIVRGTVGARGASGTIEASKGACRTHGVTWTARKRRGL